MLFSSRVRWLSSFVLLALLVVPDSVRAEQLFAGTSVNGVGTFEADFNFHSLSDTLGVVKVSIRNTTTAGDGGYLTGFAFNLPDAPISGVGLMATDPDFGLLGGPSFTGGVHSSPFGNFDVGASVGPTWIGSRETEANGFATGEGGMFAFAITGTGLSGLTTSAFLSEFSTDPGIGGSQFFAVRFRNITVTPQDLDDAVAADGTDSGVVVEVDETPEPTSLMLGLLGLTGAAGLGWKRSRKKKEVSA